MDTFQAVIQGYEDRLFDYQCLAVHQGFWAGYYSIRTKRPKSIDAILKLLVRKKLKASGRQPHAEDVDVEAYLQLEEQFNRRLEEQNARRKQES